MLPEIPITSKTIFYLYRAGKGVVNMSFDSNGIKHIVTEDFFDVSDTQPDLSRSIQVPSGYELIGLES